MPLHSPCSLPLRSWRLCDRFSFSSFWPGAPKGLWTAVAVLPPCRQGAKLPLLKAAVDHGSPRAFTPPPGDCFWATTGARNHEGHEEGTRKAQQVSLCLSVFVVRPSLCRLRGVTSVFRPVPHVLRTPGDDDNAIGGQLFFSPRRHGVAWASCPCPQNHGLEARATSPRAVPFFALLAPSREIFFLLVLAPRPEGAVECGSHATALSCGSTAPFLRPCSKPHHPRGHSPCRRTENHKGHEYPFSPVWPSSASVPCRILREDWRDTAAHGVYPKCGQATHSTTKVSAIFQARAHAGAVYLQLGQPNGAQIGIRRIIITRISRWIAAAAIRNEYNHSLTRPCE